MKKFIKLSEVKKSRSLNVEEMKNAKAGVSMAMMYGVPIVEMYGVPVVMYSAPDDIIDRRDDTIRQR